MKAAWPWLLDWHRDGVAPPDYRVVSTETELLEFAIQDRPLLVRGEHLCVWAEAICEARRYPVQTITSCTVALGELAPGLSLDQVAELVTATQGRLRTLKQPYRVGDVLAALYPDGPWNGPTSQSHPARWLLWLDATNPSPAVGLLLEQQVKAWREVCEEAEEWAYNVVSATDARRLLRQWFRIDRSELQARFPIFSLPVPDQWLAVARNEWQQKIVTEGTALFDSLRRLPLPVPLLETAAEVTAAYLEVKPGSADSSVLQRLSGYLPDTRMQMLRKICPPPWPSDVPQHPDQMIKWFEQEYLPFRQWQVDFGDDEAWQRVAGLARQFASWLVGFYPPAISGGAGKEYLAVSNAKRLKATKDDCVTLWIILDGLHRVDANTLLRYLAPETRLSIEKNQSLVSTLPTITRFCKPALMNGVPPSATGVDYPVPDFEGAIFIRENDDPTVAARSAKRGDVLVWSLLEPDKSYHKPIDRSLILMNVEGQLRTLAEKVRHAAMAVPQECPLRVFITTDHGRLLSNGHRSLAVPLGMQAEGRTAWGSADGPFDANGYRHDPQTDTITLFGPRFGLTVDCTLPLSDEAYVMTDGKGGIVTAPHGGLYPEEVLTPWIELVRDRIIPRIVCRIEGAGRARRPGTLTVTLQNPGTVKVELVGVRLLFGRDEVALEINPLSIGPFDIVASTISLEKWPGKLEASRATAQAKLRMPNGLTFECEAQVDMTSQDMYTRDLSLEEL